MEKRPLIIAIIVIAIIAGYFLIPKSGLTGKTDDWQFSPSIFEIPLLKQISSPLLSPTQSVSPFAASPESIGYSVGGAKDINNFRENIKNNYTPLSTDITYEGLFYDYYFDTSEKQECTKLFCPSYTYSISRDPFSKKDEYYMSVGLNSNIKESDFHRKKLNLIIVLDISGSMGSAFNEYYYDRFGGRVPVEGSNKTDEDSGKSKMEIAKKAISSLLDHLKKDDRFGMVVFDDKAYLAKPMNLVENTDIERIKQHILNDIGPQGGTYMESGMKMGANLFKEYEGSDQSEYENRIIFLTDAMPNIGETSEEGLFNITKKNADNKIYTTFIGIGVDFNTELVEAITKIRGANYYSVHSSPEFKKRMDNEFEFMVTPLIFNLILNLDAKGYEIIKVYGSPEANEATGTIMKINTLFPSKKEGAETRGGLVLLKLKKLSNDTNLKLTVSYEDRLGNKDGNDVAVNLEEKQSDFFQNTGIRKGILLARYADLMKNWISDERQNKTTITRETGILIPRCGSSSSGLIPRCGSQYLGDKERQSIPLKVSDNYKALISEFFIYFKAETNAIGDNTLNKEVTVIEKLSSYAPASQSK
ncbi:MAG: VWA domain-containing protein [Candidatus Aenigmarchaeota archaeon]|nr:VWA domain-containing protein [Candidatus Aenigmarchaeota archaeon]